MCGGAPYLVHEMGIIYHALFPFFSLEKRICVCGMILIVSYSSDNVFFNVLILEVGVLLLFVVVVVA